MGILYQLIFSFFFALAKDSWPSLSHKKTSPYNLQNYRDYYKIIGKLIRDSIGTIECYIDYTLAIKGSDNKKT
jgi:hypothetical protein